MITREDLLKSAPEGVDYVFVEREQARQACKVWYHRSDPCGSRQDWFSFSVFEMGDTADQIWQNSVFSATYDDELPRRWAAQREPLEKWIRELGLGEDYCIAALEFFSVSEFRIDKGFTDPHRAEKLPGFALKFLQERLHYCPKIEVDSGPVVFYKGDENISFEDYNNAVRAHAEEHMKVLSGTNSVSRGKCECGSAALNMPHSTWCPAHAK